MRSMRPVPDAPVRAANSARNAQAAGSRFARWRPARAATWAVLDEHVARGDRVAVVGAGNGHDLPLGRLARRSGALDLLDVDPRVVHRTARGARHRHVRPLVEDVTAGAADAIVRAVVAHAAGDGGTPAGDGATRAGDGERRPRPADPGAAPGDAGGLPDAATVLAPVRGPVGAGPYDVVVADLFLTQLLYPALRDSGVPRRAVTGALARYGQALTDAVLARLVASAPGGTLVVLHDLLGWWAGHEQPFGLDDVLELARTDPDAALALAETGITPSGCDPRLALQRAGAHPGAPRFWRWPFAPGADYLVCATVARTPG
jgi:hypothetical protein